MDIETAKKKLGVVVASDCDIWGTLEYVKENGWVGVRELPPIGSNRKGRIDEIQVGRIFPA